MKERKQNKNSYAYVLGIPVDVAVNIFINSFGSIQETTMVRLRFIYLFG